MFGEALKTAFVSFSGYIKKMNYKYGHIKAKKDAINDILKSEKQCFVFSFPLLKKIPKETKINIDTTKL